MYPASASLSSWTLRFPAVDWVFSFRKVNSADVVVISSDITLNLSWEWSRGSSSLNMSTFRFSQHVPGDDVAYNHRNRRHQELRFYRGKEAGDTKQPKRDTSYDERPEFQHNAGHKSWSSAACDNDRVDLPVNPGTEV